MGSSNSTEKKETNLNDYLTSLDLDFNNFERCLLIFKTVFSPNLPVNAFAFPEFTTIALTVAWCLELKLLLD